MSGRFALAGLLFVSATLAGCALVDEDMSDCGKDHTLNYSLQLVTNMSTQLQTELSLAADISVSTALQAYLKDVFTDFAHDVDLSFYDVAADSVRLHHEYHIMDARESSYTLYIPVRDYMHLAVANITVDSSIRIEDDGFCHSARLHQAVADTLDPHTTGIFTARLPMHIKEGEDQQFDVSLYMANCAEALVLDTLGSRIKDLRVYATGFATDFDMADSTYSFNSSPVFRTTHMVPEEGTGTEVCYACVNFPSHVPEPQTRLIIQTPDPDVEESPDKAMWWFLVYATTHDGAVTRNELGVRKPITPGQLRIIKVHVFDDGSIDTEDHSVVVNVTLDWTPGMEHEIVM
ncbi:MAG: hypothetical protein IJU68_02725 [Bacteroidales bacterium]|nr:hypothetical protein [Bacteroidales bacterium]